MKEWTGFQIQFLFPRGLRCSLSALVFCSPFHYSVCLDAHHLPKGPLKPLCFLQPHNTPQPRAELPACHILKLIFFTTPPPKYAIPGSHRDQNPKFYYIEVITPKYTLPEKKSEMKCSTWMQSQKQQNDLSSFPRQTIQYHSNPSLCPNQ